MHGQRGRGERHAGIFLDMAHLILGIAIVILAVLSFINPEGNHMLFPLVFLLAALLNAVSGIFECKTWGRIRRNAARAYCSWCWPLYWLSLAS